MLAAVLNGEDVRDRRECKEARAGGVLRGSYARIPYRWAVASINTSG